ncbi:hypothetical protein ACFL35_05590 [Candidatus Riflebacteria bacterium]
MRKSFFAFSLMELMLAMFVFFTTIVFVSSLFSTSNKTMANAKDEAIAFELCAEGCEWFSNMPFEMLERILIDRKYRRQLAKKLGLSINGDFANVLPFKDDEGFNNLYYDEKLIGQKKSHTDYITKRFQRRVLLSKSGDGDITRVRSQVSFKEAGTTQVLEIPALVVKSVF